MKFTKFGNRGFTLVEMLLVSFILMVVVAGTGQAVRLILSELKNTEKRQEAVDESLDLDFYVRRANKNISNSRLNNTMTFVSVGNVISVRGVNLPGRPFSSMTINRSTWIPATSTNPLFNSVNSHFTSASANLFLDSYTLEEHRLVSAAGSLDKRTRRIIISRCGEWSQYVDLASHSVNPSITAYFLLNMIPRRPFIKVGGVNPLAGINCCLPTEPNCTNRQANQYYFRSYVINLDDNEQVTTIEEFPKSSTNNSIVGSGFAMYFPAANASNSDIRSFTIKNRCQTNSRLQPEICSLNLQGQAFFERAILSQDVIQVQMRTIGVRLSNDISQTGVISL